MQEYDPTKQTSDTEIRRLHKETIDKILSGQLTPEDFKPTELTEEEKAQRELEKKEFLAKSRKKNSDDWEKARYLILGAHGVDIEDMTPEQVDLWIKVYLAHSEDRRKSMEVAFSNVLAKLFKK
jgi:hypothetical protein